MELLLEDNGGGEATPGVSVERPIRELEAGGGSGKEPGPVGVEGDTAERVKASTNPVRRSSGKRFEADDTGRMSEPGRRYRSR